MISFKNVSVEYIKGDTVLDDISLDVEKGEFVYITGRSGAGKSTLLSLIYNDVSPSRGILSINGHDVSAIPANMVPHLRRQIGIIFQDFKLLNNKTVFENVKIALDIFNLNQKLVKERVANMLRKLDIFEKRNDLAITLSGGEKQRVAIARALINDPQIVIADEPTGNIDIDNAREVISMLIDVAGNGAAVLVATHDILIRESFPAREIVLDKGKLISDTYNNYKITPANYGDKQEQAPYDDF